MLYSESSKTLRGITESNVLLAGVKGKRLCLLCIQVPIGRLLNHDVQLHFYIIYTDFFVTSVQSDKHEMLERLSSQINFHKEKEAIK